MISLFENITPNMRYRFRVQVQERPDRYRRCTLNQLKELGHDPLLDTYGKCASNYSFYVHVGDFEDNNDLKKHLKILYPEEFI